MKKILLITLSLIFLLTLSSCKESNESNFVEPTDAIVEIGFHTSNGSERNYFLLLSLGHSFLSFKNLSDEIVLVGEYNLQPNEEITVGLWAITGNFGIWYNIESYVFNHDNTYQDIQSIYFKINNDMLKDISEYINEEPSWSPFFNCSSFATNVYNIVNGTNYSSFLKTPSSLIDIFSSHTFDNRRIFQDNDNVGYIKGGEFIKCVVSF